MEEYTLHRYGKVLSLPLNLAAEAIQDFLLCCGNGLIQAGDLLLEELVSAESARRKLRLAMLSPLTMKYPEA